MDEYTKKLLALIGAFLIYATLWAGKIIFICFLIWVAFTLLVG